MKKNLIFASILWLLILGLSFDLAALPGHGGGRGGGGGGRGGGGGSRGGGGGGRGVDGRGGGGRSIQRAPTMSRTGRHDHTPRPQANRPNVQAQQRDAGRGQGARNQAQQFIRNNPAQNIPRSGHGNLKNVRDGGRNTRNNNIGRNVRNDIRSHYPNHNRWFSNDFYARQSYYPSYYNSRYNWWGAASVGDVGSWLGWESQPYYYGYDSGAFQPVYYSDVNINTNYAPQNVVQNMPKDQKWMPLGVFAITKESDTAASPTLFLQLALSRENEISGTFYNAITDQLFDVEGSVDPESQRAVFKIVAENMITPTMETGIYNLTQDEVPIRLHFSSGAVQNSLLVRVDQ